MSAKWWLGQHLRIELRNREHNPPHVHAIAKGAAAVVRLDTLEIEHHSGFNRATLKVLLNWATENQELLLEVWKNEQEKDG